MMTDARKTRIQEALRLQDVPKAKFDQMLGRTVFALLLTGVLTLFLLYFSWAYFQKTGQLSLWLTGAGVGCGFVCGAIGSGQIIGRAGATLADPIRNLRRAWKGEGGPDA